MDPENTNHENEEVQIDQALYDQLVQMRHRGSSKNRLVQYLLVKKYSQEDAEFIAQDIDEDFKNQKYAEGLENRQYAIYALIIGVVLLIAEVVYLEGIHIGLVILIVIVVGYFYNKYLIAKRTYGE